MNTFTIDQTEFLIDPAQSFVRLSEEDGETCFDIEIYGDEDQHEKVTEPEDSKFNWTIYPPQFYLRAYPGDSLDNVNLDLSIDDLDYSEIAVYFMEHNDFIGKLQINNGNITVSGKVFINDEELELSIKWRFLP